MLGVSHHACPSSNATACAGYAKSRGEKRLAQACDGPTVRSSTHNLLVSPGKAFPSNQNVLLRVVALGKTEFLLLVVVLYVCLLRDS